MKRRTFLGVAGLAATTGTLGCYRIATDENTGPDDEPNATQSHEDDPQSNEAGEADDSLMGDDENASEPNREPHNETGNESGNETESDNETNETMSGNETTADRQKRPTPDEVEPDRSQYNTGSGTTGQRETEALPPDSVSVTTNTRQEGRTYVTTGSVINEIDETIDFVDIEVVWLDASENPIGTSITTVSEIPPGASEDFRATVSIVDLKGEPESIDGTAYPQQYVD